MKLFLLLLLSALITTASALADGASPLGTFLYRIIDSPGDPARKQVQVMRSEAPKTAVTITSFERGGDVWFSPDEKWLVVMKYEYSGSAVPELYRHTEGLHFEKAKVDVSQVVLDDYRKQTGDPTKVAAHDLFCRFFGWSEDSKTFRVGLFSRHKDIKAENWGAWVAVDPFSIKPEEISQEMLDEGIQAAELAKADAELNAIYNLLRAPLSEYDRTMLKQAQLMWLRERDHRREDIVQFVNERVQTLCDALLKKDIFLATAFEDITTWERIGALRVGMTEDELVQAIGAKPEKGEEFEEGATGRFVQSFTFPKKGVSIWMSSEKKGGSKTASSLGVEAPCDFKTAKGLGIGDKEASVIAAYGHLGVGNESEPGSRFTAGSQVGQLGFAFEKGVVSKIFLGPGPE